MNFLTLGYPIVIIAAALFIFGYFVANFRKGMNDASNQSNQILRGLIDDQSKEISSLRSEVAELRKEVETNANLQDIVQNGVALYLQANPKLAEQFLIRRNMTRMKKEVI